MKGGDGGGGVCVRGEKRQLEATDLMYRQSLFLVLYIICNSFLMTNTSIEIRKQFCTKIFGHR